MIYSYSFNIHHLQYKKHLLYFKLAVIDKILNALHYFDFLMIVSNRQIINFTYVKFYVFNVSLRQSIENERRDERNLFDRLYIIECMYVYTRQNVCHNLATNNHTNVFEIQI